MKETSPLDQDQARRERIRQNAAKMALSTQLRVNEHRLKKAHDADKLAVIMARFYEVKKALELEGHVL